jgi:hypothetical protein
MHVKQTGETWSVMDGELVVQEFTTNAAAWAFVGKIERRALWSSSRNAIKNSAITYAKPDPEAA